MKKTFSFLAFVLFITACFASSPAPPDVSKNETTCFVKETIDTEIALTSIQTLQPEFLVVVHQSEAMLPEEDLGFKNLESDNKYWQGYNNKNYTGEKKEQSRYHPLLN